MSTTPTPTPAPAAKKSFFDKIGDFFKDIFDNKATWEKTASTALAVVGPLLDTVVGLTAGSAAATAVSNVITQVQKDLQAALALLSSDTGGTAKQQVTQLISGVQSQLATLLADADVKNSAEAAKITSAVNLISGELQAILDAA
jgi:hypothetical protein